MTQAEYDAKFKNTNNTIVPTSVVGQGNSSNNATGSSGNTAQKTNTISPQKSMMGAELASVFANNTNIKKNLGNYTLDIPKIYINRSGQVCVDGNTEDGSKFTVVALEDTKPTVLYNEPSKPQEEIIVNITPEGEKQQAQDVTEANKAQTKQTTSQSTDTVETITPDVVQTAEPKTATEESNTTKTTAQESEPIETSYEEVKPTTTDTAVNRNQPTGTTQPTEENNEIVKETKKKTHPPFNEDSVDLSNILANNKIKRKLANSFDHNIQVSIKKKSANKYDVDYSEFKESNIQDACNILRELNINIPSNLRLTEASSKYLNDYLDKVYADYFNQRKINITMVYKDPKSGRIILGNSKEKYYADEIKNYATNRREVSFDKYDPLTREDIANIRSQLTKFFESYSMQMEGSKLFKGIKNAVKGGIVGKFTLGSILRNKVKESKIKKFKEDTSSNLFDIYADAKYKDFNTPKTEYSAMEIEINASIFYKGGATDVLNTAYAKMQGSDLSIKQSVQSKNITNAYVKDLKAIEEIQKSLCEELNKKKFMLKYNVGNTEIIYNIIYEAGDKNNLRFDETKGVVIFSLKCYKIKDKTKDIKTKDSKKPGILSNIVNTLATASGAVVQANKLGGSGTSGKQIL